jgi:hypothetical protein
VLYTNKDVWQVYQTNGFEIINKRFASSLFITEFIETIKVLQNNIEIHRLQNFTGQMLQHHSLQSTKFMSKWIEAKNKA